MNKTRIVYSIVIFIVGFAVGFYATTPKDISKDLTVERVVVEENNKKTTTYRYNRKKEVKLRPIRKWHGRLLLDPLKPINNQIGIGYRILPNVSLEGSYEPGNNKVMLGLGVFF